ncbi:hypothetical protein SNE35_25825 [Paucibacter sp. R3-3]|uniref:Lipoprotein n=1 Tax=Roseateles agri TaxID=3098619 RepID=A0ABU5DNR6_9BURK|nr:hypothetical protein [Paucibacter sp. R3-3]MDY0747947.1 hypothetical protein [Paucibacter sp. R3-3]
MNTIFPIITFLALSILAGCSDQKLSCMHAVDTEYQQQRAKLAAERDSVPQRAQRILEIKSGLNGAKTDEEKAFAKWYLSLGTAGIVRDLEQEITAKEKEAREAYLIKLKSCGGENR